MGGGARPDTSTLPPASADAEGISVEGGPGTPDAAWAALIREGTRLNASTAMDLSTTMDGAWGAAAMLFEGGSGTAAEVCTSLRSKGICSNTFVATASSAIMGGASGAAAISAKGGSVTTGAAGTALTGECPRSDASMATVDGTLGALIGLFVCKSGRAGASWAAVIRDGAPPGLSIEMAPPSAAEDDVGGTAARLEDGGPGVADAEMAAWTDDGDLLDSASAMPPDDSGHPVAVGGTGVEGLEVSGVGPRERGLVRFSALREGAVLMFDAFFCAFGADEVSGWVVATLDFFGGPTLMELEMVGIVDVVEHLTVFALAGTVRDDEAATPDGLTGGSTTSFCDVDPFWIRISSSSPFPIGWTSKPCSAATSARDAMPESLSKIRLRHSVSAG